MTRTLPEMRTQAQRLGDLAEASVAARLAAKGWQVLGRQLRAGRAEIDVLAVDPGPPASLVVVEVRWRTRRDFGLPEETVDRRKLARLVGAGLTIRARRRLGDGTPVPMLPVRVDIVAMEPGRRSRHHRGVAGRSGPERDPW